MFFVNVLQLITTFWMDSLCVKLCQNEVIEKCDCFLKYFKKKRRKLNKEYNNIEIYFIL